MEDDIGKKRTPSGDDSGKELTKKAKKDADCQSEEFEVILRHDSDPEKVAKAIVAGFDKEIHNTIVISQDETGYRRNIEQVLNAIATLESVTHLRLVNVGGVLGKDRVWMEKFTPFFDRIGSRLESVVFDGGSLAVKEGFPVCEGPMGMEEFEDAIRGMKNCQQFDLINGFSIQYLGNPALGYFSTPQEMSLDSILNTIRTLPKLTEENRAKIKVTDQDAAMARRRNGNRAEEDTALDGFCRIIYYEDDDSVEESGDEDSDEAD